MSLARTSRLFGAVLMAGLLTVGAAEAKGRGASSDHAAHVTIVRDDHGIAHIHGRTDADAVFGMIYAQAEDDYPRILANYLNNLGLRASVEGEGAVWSDLRARMYNDETTLKVRYRQCPPWLKTLMVAWADGLNLYLAKHPDAPRGIAKYAPWMALSFSEGSIGGDIERISLEDLRAFYGRADDAKVALAPTLSPLRELQGSNGIAIAPKNTKDGHALLLINPHTSFYFRSEAKVESDQGLNVYGASTWGQFFVYQGFNAHVGWMHTSSGVVRANFYAEAVEERGGHAFAKSGAMWKRVRQETLSVPVRGADGKVAARSFTVYRTHHGPVVGKAKDKWITYAMMDRPVAALQQSFLRTKAVDYKSFMKVAALKANSSNNTLFADDKGEIAHLMPQFAPRRNGAVDYGKTVDGADPANDWKGLHALSELPSAVNPATGYVYNSNNWPYTAAGAASPKREAYPAYFDDVGENARGVHALKLLDGKTDFTLERLMTAAYDPYQPAFAVMIPKLVAAWDQLAADDPLKAKLAEPIAVLRPWDFRWSRESVAMTLSQYWADAFWPHMIDKYGDDKNRIYERVSDEYSPTERLKLLAQAVDRLTTDFGSWKQPWGEVNRFQRLTNRIEQVYDDGKPSLSVPFATSRWGSLAAFEATPRAGTKRYYGDTGNSFVAVVEFGRRVRAVAVSAGGESGNPSSPHFTDQAQRYADGALRPVYFYADDLKGHTERSYRPGQ